MTSAPNAPWASRAITRNSGPGARPQARDAISLVLEHALRPLFAYLKAVVVPTGVYAASEDWGAEGLDGRIERAAGELAALMSGLASARPAKDDLAVVPFAEQLAAISSPSGV